MKTDRPSSPSTQTGPERVPADAGGAFLPNLSSSSRVPQLDGVRGVAILMVLVAHFSNFGAHDRTFGLDRLYYFFAESGAFGVDLFFVLSGFLITGILLDTKHRTRHYFRNFYVRRVLRIFPLYYGFLAFMVFGLPVLARLMHHPDAGMTDNLKRIQWMFWLYVSNFGDVLGIDVNGTAVGAFWSLAVEEQFYLVWPLVVYLCAPKTLARVCVILVVLALLIRIGFSIAGLRWWMFTFARMDSLAIGALGAIVVRQPGVRWPSPGTIWTVVAVMSVLAFVVMPALPQTAWTPLVESWRVLCFSVAFGLLILLSVMRRGGRWLGALLSSRVLVFFGTYSYGLYVVHSLIRATLIRWWPPTKVGGSYLPWQAGFACVGMALCILVALASYHLYEKRFLNLKRFFVH